MKRIRVVTLVVAVLVFTLAIGTGVANADVDIEDVGTVEAISLNTAGEYANGGSSNSDISEDGRYVAFQSGATDLVASGVDANGVQDIYVVDRLLVTTELVSVATDGTLGDYPSTAPAITADGRYVAFQSQSTTLVDEDEAVEGLYIDIFVRDLWEDVLTLVSRGSDGEQGNGNSTNPSVTCDDTRVYVAYQSAATNLVDGDVGGRTDIFVSYFNKVDPSDVSTVLVSRRDDGAQGTRNSQDPSISGDGMTVAYESRAPLDPVNDPGNTTWDIYTTEWDPEDPGYFDTTLVSAEFHDGTPIGGTLELRNPFISADATTVSYDKVWIDADPDYSHTLVMVTDDDGTHLALPSEFFDGGLEPPFWLEYSSLSGDGRYVAYEYEIDEPDAHRYVVVYDREEDIFYPLSLTFYGEEPNGDSGNHDASRGPAITPSYGDAVPQVSFFSVATNLTYQIDGILDTHANRRDVFVGTIDTTPTINYLNPTSGPTAGGTSVYLVGTNFVGLGAAVLSASYSETEGSVVAPAVIGGPVTFGGVDALTWQRYNGRSTMKIIATSPAHAAGTVQVQVMAAGGLTADTAADDYTYVASPAEKPKSGPKRYEEDNELILYSGDWGKGEDDSLSKKAGTSSDDQQATITITFKGTKLDWIATLGPNMGKALVSIDGGEAVLVDLYSATDLYQQLVWSTGDLAYGVHVITITFPEGADYQQGKGINLDALDVSGVLLQTEEVAKP